MEKLLSFPVNFFDASPCGFPRKCGEATISIKEYRQNPSAPERAAARIARLSHRHYNDRRVVPRERSEQSQFVN